MRIYGTTNRISRIVGLVAVLISACALAGPAGSTGDAAPTPAHVVPLAVQTPADAGPPLRYQANINGANWSGYVATGSEFRSVSASWKAPAVKCNSAIDVFGPWVGLGGITSNSVEQTGIEINCSSGQARYRAWFEMAPAPPVYYDDPIREGDSIRATVGRTNTHYKMTITNDTRHWTRTADNTAVGDNSSAEVILESPTGAFPDFGRFTFTGATVDGRMLSAHRPVALDASGPNGFQDHTGPLAGGTFSISYLHQ
jgi:hypothetical protein